MRSVPEGLQTRLLDSLADVYIMVLDQEGRVMYANAAFLDHFHLRWEDVAGRSCQELVSPFQEEMNPHRGFCPLGLGPSYPKHTILSREVAGQRFTYEATVYPLTDEAENPCIVMVYRDVTAHHQMESQLQHLYELERNLIKASIDGIILNDFQGNILIFNEGASKILGYAPEEVVGKLNVSELYPPLQAHEIKHLIYSSDFGGVGMLENYETEVRHRDGSLVPIWLSARILHEDGRETGIVGYFRDLRERKRLEKELVRNERLAILGKMVAHVSHEIKNPLALIGGFARQLERLEELPDDGRRKLRIMREEVQRLEKFLLDLGSFTRISPTQRAPGDLLALIREVEEIMEPSFREKGIAFEILGPPALPPLPFDAGQMRQVLINLFKNSIEAMPQGGRLTVSLDLQPAFLHLTIRDTGQGIDPEHLKLLFNPFFSTKEGGTGLGLTICRQFIEQHQGDIQIDSQVGQGTTCVIRLPLKAS